MMKKINKNAVTKIQTVVLIAVLLVASMAVFGIMS